MAQSGRRDFGFHDAEAPRYGRIAPASPADRAPGTIGTRADCKLVLTDPDKTIREAILPVTSLETFERLQREFQLDGGQF
jgi:hypothetical protein